MRSKFLTPYLFLAPALILLVLTVFYPAIQALYLSFTDYDLLSAPEWVGLKNFRILWRDDLFWKSFWNTILYLICVVPLLVTLPLGLAILVNQKLRGIQWFRVMFYTPVVISMVVADGPEDCLVFGDGGDGVERAGVLHGDLFGGVAGDWGGFV